MILGIDTAKREKIYLTLYSQKVEKSWEFETENQTNDILIAIKGILDNEKMTLKDLRAILINQGPGSFTGTRIGVTVANTLGWSLNIPVYGYQEGQQAKIVAKIFKNPQSQFSKLALPYYIYNLQFTIFNY